MALLIFGALWPLELLAQEEDPNVGPVLESFLEQIKERDYSHTVLRDPDSTFAATPTYQISVRQQGGGAPLIFDYQNDKSSLMAREHIFNIQGGHWALLEDLLEPVFAGNSKESPAARVFLRTITTSLERRKLLAMTVSSAPVGEGESLLASLYLIMDSPGQDTAVHFTPLQEPSPAPSATEHLPLIVLEFHPHLERNHLHYLRYLVPVQGVQEEGEPPSLFKINLKTAHDNLNSFRRFAVAVDVQGESTIIYPSLYDGREIISEVTLEIYALSNYIQAFLDWFVKIWWQEFPEGRSVQMKRLFTDTRSLDLSLYRYRAQKCHAVIRSVIRN